MKRKELRTRAKRRRKLVNHPSPKGRKHRARREKQPVTTL